MEIDMTALRVAENEKGASLETLADAIEETLLEAYHDPPGAISRARIEIDKKTGRVIVMAMDEDRNGNPIGEFDDTPESFGRIAQSIARSVIIQRLRDADDQRIFGDFAGREGQIITDTIQAPYPDRPTMVQVSDDFRAVLPDGEKTPGEFYRHGDHIHAYIVSVERIKRDPRITLSRTHSNLIIGLFQREVPEIQQGLVKVKAIIRETGHRTKITVAATCEGISAKGARTGPTGVCIRPAMAGPGGEKIDIVDYFDDPTRSVASSLSPVRVIHVIAHSVNNHTATTAVPDFQLPFAISKEGRSACLAARLMNYHIDIHVDVETGGDAIASCVSIPDDVTSHSQNPRWVVPQPD